MLNNQRGAAIIVALFVTALVAVAAAAMIERLRIDIRRTDLMLNATQSYLSAQGSIAWAMEQLNTDWLNKKPKQIIDLTPIKSPIDKVNQATVSSVIYDEQGKFNLNNLVDESYRNNFLRLIQVVSPNTELADAQNIMRAVVHWISANSQAGPLDEYYAKLSTPYRAPHRLMASISELRLVKGMTPDLFSKLSPYITALPETTPININNAEAPILMSLSFTMTAESANSIVSARKQTPFVDIPAFLNFDIVKNNPIPDSKITVTSNYFLVETNVKVAEQNTMLYTLMQRQAKDAKSTVIALWQSKGTL